jgi:hypothetical protein
VFTGKYGLQQNMWGTIRDKRVPLLILRIGEVRLRETLEGVHH